MKRVELWPWFMFYVYILERTSFNICFFIKSDVIALKTILI